MSQQIKYTFLVTVPQGRSKRYDYSLRRVQAFCDAHNLLTKRTADYVLQATVETNNALQTRRLIDKALRSTKFACRFEGVTTIAEQ
jgi:hypothetical protein